MEEEETDVESVTKIYSLRLKDPPPAKNPVFACR